MGYVRHASRSFAVEAASLASFMHDWLPLTTRKNDCLIDLVRLSYPMSTGSRRSPGIPHPPPGSRPSQTSQRRKRDRSPHPPAPPSCRSGSSACACAAPCRVHSCPAAPRSAPCETHPEQSHSPSHLAPTTRRPASASAPPPQPSRPHTPSLL